MSFKKTAVVLMVLATSPAFAYQDYVTARVVSASPRYVTVERPQQECWTEYQPVSPVTKYTGAVLGGVAGGLLGSQVGDGRGNKAAIALAATAGTILGDKIYKERFDGGRTHNAVRACREVSATRRVPDGYNVTYRYDGELRRTVLSHRPGKTVRIPVTEL